MTKLAKMLEALKLAYMEQLKLSISNQRRRVRIIASVQLISATMFLSLFIPLLLALAVFPSWFLKDMEVPRSSCLCLNLSGPLVPLLLITIFGENCLTLWTSNSLLLTTDIGVSFIGAMKCFFLWETTTLVFVLINVTTLIVLNFDINNPIVIACIFVLFARLYMVSQVQGFRKCFGNEFIKTSILAKEQINQVHHAGPNLEVVVVKVKQDNSKY